MGTRQETARREMSDDIRRKKKKQARRPRNTEEKEAVVVKKETEPVPKEKSDPIPSPQQEKHSVWFKALFFIGINALVGVLILAVSGNVLQGDSLSRVGQDSFLPNLQQLNLKLESVSSLCAVVAQSVPSVQDISDLIAETLTFPLSGGSDSSEPDDIQTGEGSEQTKEVDDHEKIIKPAGSHLNTEETDETQPEESLTNTVKEGKVNSGDSLKV